MASSTDPSALPAAAAGLGPRPASSHPAPNRFATAALVFGAAGATLVTIVPSFVTGIVGLRRAAHLGTGRARCWAGMTLAACWAAAAAYVVPHVIQASDPGCRAYKGPALTAYNKVITDFSGHRPGAVAADLTRAVRALGSAAAHSRDAATSRDLTTLTQELTVIRHDIERGTLVSSSALGTLNSDAARADSDCGTLHV